MSEAQQPLNALPSGYRLQEYELVRVLGFGGFGMTYLALDDNLNKGFAIKEYLPSDLATRTADGSVAHKPNSKSFYIRFWMAWRRCIGLIFCTGTSSPSNIILRDEDDSPMLLDFGVAGDAGGG